MSVLDHGDLIDQLGCDASYAVMAPVEDEQADACEAGLGATPCSERPAGLIAYVIEPEPAVDEEGVDDSDGEGIELTALCGLPVVVSEEVMRQATSSTQRSLKKRDRLTQAARL